LLAIMIICGFTALGVHLQRECSSGIEYRGMVILMLNPNLTFLPYGEGWQVYKNVGLDMPYLTTEGFLDIIECLLENNLKKEGRL